MPKIQLAHDESIVVVKKVSALRVAKAHSLLNAARAEAEAWARQKERRVVWHFWDADYSRSYHGSNVGEVDLGDLNHEQPSLEDFVCAILPSTSHR